MIIQNGFIIAMIALAWHSFTWDEQIFSGIKKIINPEKWIAKPIYSCPICCCVWIGSLIWVIFFRTTAADWFLTIGCATGISVFSVIAIYIKDYCKSRTRGKGCLGCEGESNEPPKITESDVDSW